MKVNPRMNFITLSIIAALNINDSYADTFSVTTNADSGAGSLRQAIEDANANADILDTIDLTPIAEQSIVLQSSLPMITDELELLGANVTVDGDDAHTIFFSYEDGLDISDLVITGGVSYYYYGGGGIYIGGGDLVLNNVTVTGNNSDGAGGGIVANGGNAFINNSLITNNTATGVGGGIVTTTSSLFVESSIISSNNAATGGGVQGGVLGGIVFRNSEISNNSADSAGGGMIYRIVDTYETIFENTTISGNASNDIGGLFILHAETGATPIELINTTITENTVIGPTPPGLLSIGGVSAYTLFGTNGELIIDSCTITNNDATDVGGVFAFNTVVPGTAFNININNSVIQNNAPTDLESAAPPIISTALIQQRAVDRITLFFDNLSPRLRSQLPFTQEERLASIAEINAGGVDNGVTFNTNFSAIGSAPVNGEFNLDSTSAGLLGVDPLLGPLADNGGPTLTMLPGENSPLINAVPIGDGNCGTAPLTDQRGFPRPSIGACDVGSVEVQGVLFPAPPSVPALSKFSLILSAILLGILGGISIRRYKQKT